MLLEFRKAGLIPADVARAHDQPLGCILEREVALARSLQKPAGRGWKDDPPYADVRDMVGLLFDVAGFLDAPPIMHAVEEAAGLVDARLRRFRAVSMLRRGIGVPDAELEAIAQSPRDRFWLLDQLEDLGMRGRAPAACLDQEKLAEGHMVDWLCFGTELGREPDEIELIRKETRRRTSNGPRTILRMFRKTPVDYYFFRFRVTEEHWSRDKGWMVGVAGGYARDEQPTTSHDGGTFSHFTPLAEKSLDEHVAAFLH